MDNQSIVFAYYKNNKLMGYRQNTLGMLTFKDPKIYVYSKEQVDTIMNNIRINLANESKLGECLGIDFLAKAELNIHEKLQDEKVFEVRVIKSPDMIYEKEFDVQKAEWVIDFFSRQYPQTEMEIFLNNPDEHEVIETHYFSVAGEINFQ